MDLDRLLDPPPARLLAGPQHAGPIAPRLFDDWDDEVTPAVGASLPLAAPRLIRF
jgi:hypothetical protein